MFYFYLESVSPQKKKSMESFVCQCFVQEHLKTPETGKNIALSASKNAAGFLLEVSRKSLQTGGCYNPDFCNNPACVDQDPGLIWCVGGGTYHKSIFDWQNAAGPLSFEMSQKQKEEHQNHNNTSDIFLSISQGYRKPVGGGLCR